ncbi:MAG: SPASM domain-containing protein [Bryobacteraceae bacterium]|nr:SPASM domain-containing protein [Bryobacteraceae bacterium]
MECPHCYTRQFRYADLSEKECEVAAQKLLCFGVRMVGFGGGEPLCHPALTAAAAALAPEAVCSLTSNGVFWSITRARELRQAGLASVAFSIDFPTAEENAAFRQCYDYADRVIRAVACAKEAGFDVGICCTIMRSNRTRLDAMVEWASTHGAEWVRFNSLKCVGNAHKLSALEPAEWRSAYQILDELSARSPIPLDFGQGSEPLVDVALHEIGSPRAVSVSDRLERGSLCGKSTFCVRPDGTVTPCSYLDLPVGNVLRDDLEALWESATLSRLRDRVADSKCAACGHWDLCRGGCPASAYAATGDACAPDPGCWNRLADERLWQEAS